MRRIFWTDMKKKKVLFFTLFLAIFLAQNVNAEIKMIKENGEVINNEKDITLFQNKDAFKQSSFSQPSNMHFLQYKYIQGSDNPTFNSTLEIIDLSDGINLNFIKIGNISDLNSKDKIDIKFGVIYEGDGIILKEGNGQFFYPQSSIIIGDELYHGGVAEGVYKVNKIGDSWIIDFQGTWIVSFYYNNSNPFVFPERFTTLQFQSTLTINPLNISDGKVSNFWAEFTTQKYQEVLEERFSYLESWKQTITNTIANLTTSVTQLFAKSNDHQTRITALENKNNTEQNITTLNYWKYMGSGDRKNIVCGIATDNHLNTLAMQELGWKCDVAYKQTLRGETSSCKCKKL